jgi:ectoine hydroxylase-related dioxygenase (phytanoyl-CoA dioxygenase family)
VKTPTAEQIAQYRRDGFVRIPDFLDAGELERWRAATDEAVAQRVAASGDGDGSYYSRVFIQSMRLADTHAGMAELILDPRLGEIVATLAGIDGVRVWHDQALIKQAYGNPTAWHLDDPFWSFDSPDAISIWIALDDATIENGCLWYLPGSQRGARYETTQIGENFGALFDEYPDWLELEPVAAPCPAGGAVFHNGLVAHAAGANMTPRPRRAMTCAFMPDGARYNGRPHPMFPDDYVARLRMGDPLENDELLPLVWHRSASMSGTRGG